MEACRRCRKALGEYSCSCSTPETLVCAGCIPNHIETGPTHTLTRLCQTEVCSMCKHAPAEKVCLCGSNSLCIECIPQHCALFLTSVHDLLPIKAKAYLTVPGYISRLKERRTNTETRWNEFSAVFKRVEKCGNELDSACDELIGKVEQCRKTGKKELSDFLERLTIMKNEAAEEVETYIFDEGVVLQLPMSRMLIGSNPIKMFDFACRKEPVLTALSDLICISYEVANPAQPLIPYITRSYIAMFDCSNETWGPTHSLSIETAINHNSTAVLLRDGLVFICSGSNPPSPKAYEIHPNSGQVDPKPDMHTPRYSPGIIEVNKSIYIFGGFRARRLTASERFSREENVWIDLPDMNAGRDCFNPCIQGSVIYLCGGRGTDSVETFDVVSELFRRTEIELPGRGGMHATSVVIEDQLVVLQPGKVTRWSLPTLAMTENRSFPCERE